MTLVYLRKQRVCGLGKDCGGKTSDDATAKQDRELGGGREVGARLLGHIPESDFMAQLIDSELADRVWNLPRREMRTRS